MKTVLTSVALVVMLLVPVAVAHAVMGLLPTITSSTTCDYTCPETYEVKCTQSSKTLFAIVEDDYGCAGNSQCADTYVAATLVGLTPTSMYGHATATPGYLAAGDTFLLYLVRPGGEGTMKALLTVTAAVVAGGDHRDFRVRAYCSSDATGQDRTTSLNKVYDF